VDDAIVVLENIYRHLQKGEDPKEAAINGRSEIGLAAISITLVDVVVFLPIAFMGGIVGQFFKPLALGFVFAVLSSLFVSFTVTPMLAARWYRRGENVEHPTGAFARGFEAAFGGLTSFYRGALIWALKHRWFVFILGNLALVAVIMFIAGSFAKTPAAAIQSTLVPVGIAAFFGLLVFVINIFRGHLKPQFILYGLMFGMIFPFSAAVGQMYGAYKKEAVFKFAFFPESDAGSVGIAIELPPGASLQETERVVRQIEDIVSKHEYTKYVQSTVGGSSGGFFGGGGNTGSNFASVRVTLYDRTAIMDKVPFMGKHDEKLRPINVRAEGVAADMLEAIGRIPGADIKVSASDAQGFGAPIQLALLSDDRSKVIEAANKIKEGLQGGVIAGVINPDTSTNPGKPEIRAIPDRARLADAGLTPAEIGASLRTLYQGNDNAKYREDGREYPINVRLAEEDRNDPNLLATVPVAFVRGNPVYLGSVTDTQPAPGVDRIDRRDRLNEVRVTADLLPGYAAGSVQAQVDAWIKAQNLIPEGVTVKPLGQADAQQREGAYLMLALAMGFILVYMVLASLYDNLLYPAIIQLAQPQAMVGALLALIITDKPLNIVGMIGIITLVGLVGKNAILLVDYANTLRLRGRSRHDALVEAGPVRLRPIMMTTIALVLGTLPVALAIGRGSEFRETIGITIIGGITLSTFLTLLVIPCSYTIFDDLSLWIGRKLGRKPESPDGDEALTKGTSESEERPTALV
jgi:HAE1 family hydrophobic/amphiphilic exporter-1